MESVSSVPEHQLGRLVPKPIF